MPKFEIELTDEQVEGIKETVIRDMPPQCPRDPKGFLEWFVQNNLESRKKDQQLQRVGPWSGSQLKEALDDYEKKPKTK